MRYPFYPKTRSYLVLYICMNTCVLTMYYTYVIRMDTIWCVLLCTGCLPSTNIGPVRSRRPMVGYRFREGPTEEGQEKHIRDP